MNQPIVYLLKRLLYPAGWLKYLCFCYVFNAVGLKWITDLNITGLGADFIRPYFFVFSSTFSLL